MQVKIKNLQLNDVIGLLYELKLKSKQSRHRTRFIKILSEHLRQVYSEEKELAKQYCHLNEDGEPKKSEDGKRWDVKEEHFLDFAKDRNELYMEEFIIEGANHQQTLEVVRDILADLDVELDGQMANVYFELCEQFGVDELEGEDE